MFRNIKNVLNGEWVRLIIDNFDPYGDKQQIDIEFNKKNNEELELSNKENAK